MRLAVIFVNAPSGVSIDYVNNWNGGLPEGPFDYVDMLEDKVTIYPTEGRVGECGLATFAVDGICDDTPCLIRIVQ